MMTQRDAVLSEREVDPEVIWLSPTCKECAPLDERTWCVNPDNVCDGCDRQPVRYVLSARESQP